MGKGKVTSKRVAKIASKVLGGNYSKRAKSAAASALSQRPKKAR